ncbi:MAG: hypothetical protein ACLFM0_09810 [Spirochaetales bacterium]
MMRAVTAIILASALVFGFAACENGENGENGDGAGFAPEQEATGYAYVHGGYVGRAVATTDDEGALSVELDEAFLPHSLAEVDLEEDEWNEDNTVTYVIRGDEVRVAQHIEYDGTPYVGTTVGESVTYVEADEDGEPVGGKDLELEILAHQDTMAEYFDVIQDEGFGVMTEAGGEVEPVTSGSYGQVTKRGSDYWDFGPLGWQGNAEATEEFIAENGVNYSREDLERAEEEDDDGLRVWSVADAVTGATWSDFPDYFTVAQIAVAQLERE